jgi:IS30 family transposase
VRPSPAKSVDIAAPSAGRCAETSGARTGERTGPFKAQSYTNQRRRISRRNSQFSAADWTFVDALVRQDWSPEQIVGWCARFRLLAISHETIYRRIWADKKQGGTLWTHLCAS